MKSFFLLSCMLYSAHTWAQKTSLDTSVLGKWPQVEQVGISNDGHAYYYVLNVHRREYMSLRSDRKGLAPFPSCEVQPFPAFTEDSRYLIFINGGDSLGVVDLASMGARYFAETSSFHVSGGKDKVCVAFLSKGNGLSVYFPGKGRMLSFAGVKHYLFDNMGRRLVIVRSESGSVVQVQLVDLFSERQNVIWTGQKAEEPVFDGTGRQLAFVGTGTGKAGLGIYYYDDGKDSAIEWVDQHSQGMENGFGVAGEGLRFSQDGRRLLFSVERNVSPQPAAPATSTNVVVWNYKDRFLPSEQMANPEYFAGLFTHPASLSSVEVGSSIVTGVQEPGEYPSSLDDFNDWVLLYRTGVPGDSAESNYHELSLVSAAFGKKLTLSLRTDVVSQAVSPGGRFAIWYDRDSHALWCYDTKTATKRSISDLVPRPLYNEGALKTGHRPGPFGIPAWTEGDKSLLVYDQYDIWAVDPTGDRKAVCITKGMGRSSGIAFSLVNTKAQNVLVSQTQVFTVPEHGPLFLAAYNGATKENGFWRVGDLSSPEPKRLVWGPYYYYVPRVADEDGAEYAKYSGYPVKAGAADTYLICRMNEKEYPNYYITKDFKSFVPLTDLHPEAAYNWLTTTLVHWKMEDGKMSQGILYRPENFDSTKKYPLIFDYYERRSDELHEYLFPAFCNSRIDIPYFVSNGYLVFVPDIYYQKGHNGEGARNAVVSAARFLSQFPWVDSTRMGLQGHSFGGAETNFLVTHSTMFRAACEVAGVSDQISGYDELQANRGTSRQDLYEGHSQGSAYGPGVTPWTVPALYMENSAVFFADRAVTPLLIVQGDADHAVPFGQSIEWYMALRRAGKKVWLLEYQKEDHILHRDAARDFTIRIRQFFDYYLKNSPPPKWMTIGVPAYQKGADTGLELDQSGKLP